MEFPFAVEPFAHQREEFFYSRNLEARAFWWEMGCAKSKPAIDTGCHLFMEDKIDAMIVMAPSGVHSNWFFDEIPMHLSPVLEKHTKVFHWLTSKRHTLKYKAEFEQFLAGPRCFRIFCISYDSMMTDDSARIVKKFQETHRTLFVLDESDVIKNPDTAVAKRLIAASKYSPYRRVLSGTPVDESPFSIYQQAKFVDPDIWKRIGISNYSVFKAHFGVFEKRFGANGGHAYNALLRYRNLDQLNKIILSIGSRWLKSQVLDLPEKIYEIHYFEMSREQQRLYDELKRDYVAWFGDGKQATAELAIVRMTRLQQITSGYLPADQDGDEEPKLQPLFPEGKNPRVSAFMDVVDRIGSKSFIGWGKYDVDVDSMSAALTKAKISHVTYDGRTSEMERNDAKQKFNRGGVQAFLGKPSAAGRGLTLTRAKFAIYYNNSFGLTQRRQSEDRNHRAGMGDESPLYVDLAAAGSIDRYILESLRRKRTLAASVMGDTVPPWVPL